MKSNKIKMILIEVWDMKKDRRLIRYNIFFYGVIMTREEKITDALRQVRTMAEKSGIYATKQVDYRHHVGNQ